MQWPYPSENTDPWYLAFVAFVTAMETSAFATVENTQVILMGGGTTGLSGDTLTWSEAFEFTSPYTGYLHTLAAGSIEVLDGQLVYVELARNLTENATVTAAVTSVRTAGQSLESFFVLGVRRGSVFYFRNGLSAGGGAIDPLTTFTFFDDFLNDHNVILHTNGSDAGEDAPVDWSRVVPILPSTTPSDSWSSTKMLGILKLYASEDLYAQFWVSGGHTDFGAGTSVVAPEGTFERWRKHPVAAVVPGDTTGVTFEVRMACDPASAVHDDFGVWFGLVDDGQQYGSQVTLKFEGCKNINGNSNWFAGGVRDTGIAMDGNPHNFKCVFDPSVPTARYYIDGVLVATEVDPDELPGAGGTRLQYGAGISAMANTNTSFTAYIDAMGLTIHLNRRP